jgi:hypothetical protein
MSETNNIYKPNETVISMILKNFIWGLIGIVLGVIVNIIIQSTMSQVDVGYQSEIKLLLQLAICSGVLAFIHVNINNEFGWTWQNITPGLFFVSYFFGTQFATFTNIQKINDNLITLFTANK